MQFVDGNRIDLHVVAIELGYEYNYSEGRKAYEFLEHVRQLPDDANEIYWNKYEVHKFQFCCFIYHFKDIKKGTRYEFYKHLHLIPLIFINLYSNY